MPARTLEEIERVVRASWSVESCDPADAANWSPENPARGQCGSTALVLNDLLGGDLLTAEVHYPDGSRQGYHHWNRFGPGLEVDLTLEQFFATETVQEPRVMARPPQVGERVREQYRALRKAVYAALELDPNSP
ncbi:hypothetical protein AB0M79_21745 [Polymorphospora sp. NPDC051019]|uniref:YunG family protein n=1 Tax=Polymorphospora sp. NPDC051019 TaxID=3155725 RepID=UPI0034134B17